MLSTLGFIVDGPFPAFLLRLRATFDFSKSIRSCCCLSLTRDSVSRSMICLSLSMNYCSRSLASIMYSWRWSIYSLRRKISSSFWTMSVVYWDFNFFSIFSLARYFLEALTRLRRARDFVSLTLNYSPDFFFFIITFIFSYKVASSIL